MSDIVLYGEEDSNRPVTFQDLYPLATEPQTDQEALDFQILATDYTGGETINVKRYLSGELADGTKYQQTIWIWGLLCYRKERVIEATGEVVSNVGVVFRLGSATEPSDMFMSFESVAAIGFVKRTFLPLMLRGMIDIGDWNRGLAIAVWETPAKVGHTYRFKLLKASEVN